MNFIPTGLQFRQTFEILKLNTKPEAGILPQSGSIFVWVEVDLVGSGESKRLMYRDETGNDRNFLENVNSLTDEQVSMIEKIGETENGELVYNNAVYTAPKPLEVIVTGVSEDSNSMSFSSSNSTSNSDSNSTSNSDSNSTSNSDELDSRVWYWLGQTLIINHDLNALVSCSIFDDNNVIAYYPVETIDNDCIAIHFPYKVSENEIYRILIGFGASVMPNTTEDINEQKMIALILALS